MEKIAWFYFDMSYIINERSVYFINEMVLKLITFIVLSIFFDNILKFKSFQYLMAYYERACLFYFVCCAVPL